MDQYHTRGTNIKFPPKAKAGVSLAKDLTRDELAQGCMRLRMLMSKNPEERQSIVFIKPIELDIKRNDVLRWAYDNTKRITTQHSYLWAIQANDHYTSLPIQQDSHTLEEMYAGNYVRRELLQLIKSPEFYDSPDKYNERIELEKRISRMCCSLVSPNDSAEEQERELEKEIEQEYEIERPTTRKSHKFVFNERLMNPQVILKDYVKNNSDSSLVNEQELYEIPYLKGMHYYWTREYVKIFVDSKGCTDFTEITLRSVQYLLVVNKSVILIHQQEANEILHRTQLSYSEAQSKLGLYCLSPRKWNKDQGILPGTIRNVEHSPDDKLKSQICYPQVLDLAISSLYYENSFELADTIGLVPINGYNYDARKLARENEWIDDEGFGSLNGEPHPIYRTSPLPKIKEYYNYKYEKYDRALSGTDYDQLFNLLHIRQ